MRRPPIAVFAVLVSATLLGSAIQTASAAPPAKKVKTTKPTIAIYVKDMHCASCAKKISRKLYTVKSVHKVQTNVKKNVALITPVPGKAVSPKAVWEAMEAVKFKPVKIVYAGKAYTTKPKS